MKPVAMKPHESMGIKGWGKGYIANQREQTHLLLNGGIYHVPVGVVHKPNRKAKPQKITSKSEKHCTKCDTVYQYTYRDKRDGKLRKTAECKTHEHSYCRLTPYGIFLKNIGDDMDKGIKNYICEQKTPVFRMHADLDIIEPNIQTDNGDEPGISMERLIEWITEMQYVMNEFFGKGDDYVSLTSDSSVANDGTYQRLAVIVCTAPSKEVEKNKKMCIKTGVHIIWPFIFCNTKNAQMIRYGWLQHFEKKYGNRDINNPWQDVFDMSVYTTNGLRMVGSDKMDKCISGKGKKAKDGVCLAGICNGTDGKYSENRVYRASMAFENIDESSSKKYTIHEYKKLIDEVKVCGFNEVLFTSIRTAKTATTPMKTPEWYDIKYFSDEQEKHRRVFDPTPTERKKTREKISLMSENKETMSKIFSNKHKVTATDEECKVVQQWLKDTDLPGPAKFPDIYRNTKIMDMTRLMGDDGFPFYFARVDSCFCMNIRDEHNHNSIYFLINKWGLYQKCFCTCETPEGRAFGVCKTYKSGLYVMPDYVISELFPMIAAQNSELDYLCHTQDLSNLDLRRSEELLKFKRAELELRYQHLAQREQNKYQKRFQSKRD